MARQPRFCRPGFAHLVQLQAIAGSLPLAGAAQRTQCVGWLRDGLDAAAIRLHAYAILPASIRLLLTPASAAALSSYVQTLARRSSRVLSRAGACATAGAALWAGRFRSAVVQPGDWELAAMLWVDLSADAAAPAPSADAGAWSSRGAHCGDSPSPAGAPGLWPPAAYWDLGNTPFAREAAYRQRVEQGLDAATRSALDAALRRGTAVGDAGFLRQLEQESGRRLLPVQRGRTQRSPAIDV